MQTALFISTMVTPLAPVPGLNRELRLSTRH